MSKDHSVTVTITSVSGDAVNQEIICKEYAATPEELVYKNFTITDHVIPAVDAAMKKMAEDGGFLPSQPPGKPKSP
jgi:hypothetical protein